MGQVEHLRECITRTFRSLLNSWTHFTGAQPGSGWLSVLSGWRSGKRQQEGLTQAGDGCQQGGGRLWLPNHLWSSLGCVGKRDRVRRAFPLLLVPMLSRAGKAAPPRAPLRRCWVRNCHWAQELCFSWAWFCWVLGGGRRGKLPFVCLEWHRVKSLILEDGNSQVHENTFFSVWTDPVVRQKKH